LLWITRLHTPDQDKLQTLVLLICVNITIKISVWNGRNT